MLCHEIMRCLLSYTRVITLFCVTIPLTTPARTVRLR